MARRRTASRKQRGGGWDPRTWTIFGAPAPAPPPKVDTVAKAVPEIAEAAVKPLPDVLTDPKPIPGLAVENPPTAAAKGGLRVFGGRRRSKRRKHRKSTKRR